LTPSIHQPTSGQKISHACADDGDFLFSVLLSQYRGDAQLYQSILSVEKMLQLSIVVKGLHKACALFQLHFCIRQGSILLLWLTCRGGCSGIVGWTVSDNGDVTVIHIIVGAAAHLRQYW
jgi:hypothetical protein